MKKIYIILFSCSLILWLGAVFTGPVVHASEGTGGQVSTTGKISFYEETGDSNNISDTDESSIETPIKSDGKHLPSTGEQVRTYLLIGGCFILLAFLLLFLQQCRSEGQE